MKAKKAAKSSKELKKGQKIQPVKSLRIVVRKSAGEDKIEF
jgi:hypothetical protein